MITHDTDPATAAPTTSVENALAVDSPLDVPPPLDTASDAADFPAVSDHLAGSADPTPVVSGAGRAGRRAWRGIRRADGLVDPIRLLVELALDPLLTRRLVRALRHDAPIVVVVVVPSAAWIAAVEAAILNVRSDRSVRCVSVPIRPRPAAGRDPDREAADLLADGRPVVAITPEIGWIAPVLAAAADHILTVPGLDADLINRAIALWCGRRSRSPVQPGDLAGLDLYDVAASLRPGARPAECRARLGRASRARTGPGADAPATPLAALTGYGAAHGWAADLVAEIARVRRGEANLLEGAVFYGIPGTGKTTLARAIAAAAGVPYAQTNVGAWFSGSSGTLDGVIKAAQAFYDGLVTAAKTCGTAIGFLDEIDALPNRNRLSDRGADWWLPVINYNLVRVEEVRKSGVVLIAATNDLGRVDPALLRPGRLDRQFEILPPDEAGRLGILRAHLRGDLVDADLTAAVRITPGATGAVLAGSVRAARRRARAQGRVVTLADLMAEIAPADPRPPEQLRATALHEAGHALVAHRLGLSVAQVTIRPRMGLAGATVIRLGDPTPDRASLERRVVSLLAGRAADAVLGSGPDAGASRDLHEATGLIAAIHGCLGLGAGLTAPVTQESAHLLLREDRRLARLVEAELRRLETEAVLRVRADRAAILALVEALLETRVLAGEEVAAIAAAHRPRLRVPARRRPASGRAA